PLRIRGENVVLCLQCGRGERVGRGVIIKLGVPPIAAVGEPLAIPHHEIDIMQAVSHQRRSLGLSTLLRIPMHLRHLGAAGLAAAYTLSGLALLDSVLSGAYAGAAWFIWMPIVIRAVLAPIMWRLATK